MKASFLKFVTLLSLLAGGAEAASERKARTNKKARLASATAKAGADGQVTPLNPAEDSALVTPLTSSAAEGSAEDFPMPPPPALAPAPAATPSVKHEPSAAEAPGEQRIGLDVALKVSMLVPSGNTSGASAAVDSAATAAKGFFGAGSLALRYALPFGSRPLSLAVEGGFYRLSGTGSRAFANDPDYGPELRYAWKVDAIPVLAGFAYRLPFGGALSLSPTAGFAAVNVSSESTYSSGESGEQVTSAAQRAWALGFYAGAEAALALGPGSLVAEFRYMNARTDLDFVRIYPDSYNQSPGDVGGSQLLLGYRYAF